jgi:hypothetical protein
VIIVFVGAIFISGNLSEKKVSSILDQRLQCTSLDNIGVGSQSENGNAYCGAMGKKCLIAERQVKTSRYLNGSKSQTYLTDTFSQNMSCESSFRDFEEKSEIVSGNDPDLFVNVEFNAICCNQR